MMNERLKTVVQWTIYYALITISIWTFLSLMVCVLAPTVSPHTNISGFKDYVNTFAIILSFLSVLLGLFSVWQAYVSGKQSAEMINSLQDLKQRQNELLVTLKSTSSISSSGVLNRDNWMTDDVTK